MRPEGGHYDSSTLRDYLRVVQRRKWIILTALVLVPLASVWLSLRQTPLYQASADVLMGRTNIAASLTGIQDPITYYRPERAAQTQAELARLPALAENVVKAAGVDRSGGYLLGSSFVSASEEADVLSFTVTDTSPEVAARLADAYAREYIEFSRELETGALVSAREEVEDRIAELEARGESDSALYANLVDKEQQLRTIEALQASSAFVVRPTSGAYQTQPRPVRNGMLGLALALVLGIALAFLREALDTRVRATEEIERLGLPLLARLPEPPRRLRSKNRLVMLAEPNGAQAEAFRMLKTNLEFVNLDRSVKTIMVTSAVEGEGKSTTVANLAVTFARAGERVVLVDLDLRRPVLNRFFGLRGRSGLTQVALGHADLEDALVSIAVSSPGRNDRAQGNGKSNGHLEGLLEVLPSGPIPPDVGEFVGTGALMSILDSLRGRADVVLIDAPPLLHVGDTRLLASKVDGVILVTRLNVLRRPMLKEVQRVLDATPAAKLGFVITAAEAEEGYGYGAYARSYGRPASEKELVS